MYADVKELYRGAAQSLQETLRLSAAVVSGAASNRANITTPSSAHLPPTNARQSSSNCQRAPITPLDTNLSNGPTSDIAPDTTTARATTDSIKRYLLLCVNSSKKVHLEQIDISYMGDDQVLFQSIRQAYYNMRKSQTPGQYLNMPGFLASAFGEISFSRPKLANFVRVRTFLRKLFPIPILSQTSQSMK
jgi:hypothetical protein